MSIDRLTDASEVYNQILKKAHQKSVLPLVRRLLENVEQGGKTADSQSYTTQKHPLGFFALRWLIDRDKTLRIHLWDRSFAWRQDPDWQIHNHVFDFQSLILLGRIQNKVYEPVVDISKRWSIYSVSYSGAHSELAPTGRATGLRVKYSEVQTPGMYYSLQRDILHRSALRSDVALTILATSTPIDNNMQPLVIGSGKEFIKFDRSPMSQKEMKDIVFRFRKMLPSDRSQTSIDLENLHDHTTNHG